jgi:beta-lactamase regulating signal transducer with metallopeptidase domain
MLTLTGWAVIHFLWQALILAAGLAICLRLADGDARWRYGIAAATLFVLIVLPLLDAAGLRAALTQTGARAGAAVPPAAVLAPIRAVTPIVPMIAGAWMVWAIVQLARAGGGWWLVQRLAARDTRAAGPAWQAAYQAACRVVPTRRAVTLLESPWVDVPTVVGLRRPVILVPASGPGGLTVEELEGILAHELAHVRRGDLLGNLLQVLSEAPLSFHPAVWWVSRTIREEREASCDALAARAIGDRRRYARALARLEISRHHTLALAVSGGSVLRRLRRLTSPSARAVAGPLRGRVALLTSGALVAALSTPVGAAVLPGTLAALRPGRVAPDHYVVHARDDAGPFTLAVNGGRVVRAVVGGVAVPPAAIRQVGDSVRLPWRAGDFAIRLLPAGGLSWSSRTP